MSVPSFLFSALDEETLSLANELEALGGGDASAQNVLLHAFVVDEAQKNKNDCQVLFDYGNMIGLRDVLLPRNHPSKDNMKYFPTTSVSMGYNSEEIERISDGLVINLTQGFNGCLLSVGMRATCKTQYLFGTSGLKTYNMFSPGNYRSDSLVSSILTRIFDSSCKNTNTIAVSVWILCNEQLVDLITPVATGTDPLDFATVECPDLTTALRIVHETRLRAQGAVQYNDHINVSEKDRCHFFLRIALHTTAHANSDTGTLSTLLIADLLGLVNIDEKSNKSTNEQDLFRMRSNNLQLSSLFTVLREMSTLSRSAATGQNGNRAGKIASGTPPLLKMTSARDSKLSALLAPILQGNTHTTIAMFLRDGERHASDSRQILSAMNGVTDIVSACYKVKDVPKRVLNLKQYDAVLGHLYLPPSSAVSRPSQKDQSSAALPQPSSMVPAAATTEEYSSDLNASTDYGENFSLDRVLAGDYVRKADKSNAQPPLNSQHTITATLPAATASTMSRTMDAFHELMNELQREEAVGLIPESPSIAAKSLTTNFLSRHETKHRRPGRAEDWQHDELPYSAEAERDYLSTLPPLAPLNVNYLESIDEYDLSPNSRKDRGRYGGMLSEEGEDNCSPMNKRSVTNAESNYIANRDIATELRDMTATIRGLGPTTSAEELEFIERQIRQMVSGDGDIPSEMPTSSNAQNAAVPSSSLLTSSSRVQGKVAGTTRRNRYDEVASSTEQAFADMALEDIETDIHDEGIDRDSLNTTLNDDDRIDSYTSSFNEKLKCKGIGGIVNNSTTTSVLHNSEPMHAESPVLSCGSAAHQERNAYSSFRSIDSDGRYASYNDIFQEKLRVLSASQQQQPDVLQESLEHIRASHESVGNSSSGSLFLGRSDSPGRKSNPVTSSSMSVFHDAAIPDRVVTTPSNVVSESTDLSEVERLRRAQGSLLEALREERATNAKLSKELSNAKDDILEVRTQCDVQLDTQKIEILQLRNQLRSLCDNHSMTDVFAMFEEGVARLTRENAILRQQNLELELKELEILERGRPLPLKTVSDESLIARNNTEKYRLLTKLKKSGQERESLKDAYEALKGKERQFVLSTKMAQDASRRLRISHQELLRVKKDLECERTAHAEKDRDLQLIRRDTVELKQSERQLREERARLLSELGMLRERVLQMDDERRRHEHMQKFVEKHTAPSMKDGTIKRGYLNDRSRVISNKPSNVNNVHEVHAQSMKHSSDTAKTTSSSYRDRLSDKCSYQSDSEPQHNVPVMYERSSTDRHVINNSSSFGVQGVAGLSNAQHSRPEESANSADLETILSSMHEGILVNTPTLLPVFRKLTQQIHVDRTRALEQRAKLLEMVYPTQSSHNIEAINRNVNKPSHHNKELRQKEWRD